MPENLNTRIEQSVLKYAFLGVFLFLALHAAAQKKNDQLAAKLLVDSLRFVTDIPTKCTDSILEYSPGCGDRLFWKVVQQKKAAIPFLIDKLDDTTSLAIPVPGIGGNYTVADVAFEVMREIIDSIPVPSYGTPNYWKYLRADIRHRREFQRKIRDWEKRLGGRWIESNRVLTCECTFPHPNGGHYIKQYTLSNYTGFGVHVEYSYLKAHSVGLGMNFISESFQPFIGKRRINYTVDGTITGLFYNGIAALGQRIDLGINVSKTSPDFHLFVEHNDKNDFRIGGKVGVSFNNFIYLHYRYSYPLTRYENPYISRHGVGITFKLNWVPVTQLFGY